MRELGLRLFLLFSFFLFTSCLGFYVKNPKEFEDYDKVGWLNDNVFQFQVEGSPSENSYSLVERRKSAKNRAIRNFYSAFVSAIAKIYEIDSISKIELLGKKLLQFRDKIQLVREYYVDLDKCVLIYRVFDGGLKSDIESIVIKVKKGKDV